MMARTRMSESGGLPMSQKKVRMAVSSPASVRVAGCTCSLLTSGQLWPV